VSGKDNQTRADLVRQRRKEQEIRRAKRPAKPAAIAAPSMPRRGATLDASTVRAKPGSRYVHYDAIALPARGSQVDAPALPHFQVGWRLLSLSLVILFAALIYVAWTLPTFRVSAAALNGNQMLSAEEVESVLRLHDAPIFLVVPGKLETALRNNFPEITSVKVSVGLPNRVSATITERVPVIRWEQDGAYAWVDEQGVIFRPRGEMQNLVVVSASGTPPPGVKAEDDPLAPIPYISEQVIESIRQLAPLVPQGSVLLFNPQYGLGWVDARGWTAWFGINPQEVEMKLRVYTALVDSLGQRGITPSFISVAHPGAPYYRLGQ
jgi:hypothetical protein